MSLCKSVMVNINILYICTGSDNNSIIIPMNKPMEKIMEYTLQKSHYQFKFFDFSLQQWLKKTKRYYATYQQRQELSRLSDAQLQDIGISRQQALEESSKPFWK